MPILKQPERGVRVQYEARYGHSVKLARGMNDDHDSATLPDEAVALAENVRVHGGVIVCRGGQSKANTVALAGSVLGMVETEDVP